MVVARRIRGEILGVFAVLFAIYLMLSLASHDPWDPSFFTYTTAPTHNYGGIVGSYLADFLLTALGIASFAIPAFLFALGAIQFAGRGITRLHLAGGVLFLLSTSLLAGLVVSSFAIPYDGGGIFGRVLARVLVGFLSTLGAYLLSLALFISSVLLLSPVSLVSLVFPTGATPDESEVPAEETGAAIEDVAPGEQYVVEPPDADGAGEKPAAIAEAPSFKVHEAARIETAEVSPEETHESGYRLPTLDFLREYDRFGRPSTESLIERSSLLEQKLADYAVKGRVSQVYTGPVVTMYEFEPAPGVKINRVVSLADDLALALKAQSIRISTVPGKSAIGIEVPNAKREIVALKEIMASESFRASESLLTFALGKDIFGKPVIADLARMPHLLVAGATGSGKSVALNTMILSLLYRATPAELKLLMIDPKLLELSIYDGIPHLISPVVTNPKDASTMLKKMVFEMERRYRLIAERGVRNIDSYNASVPLAERIPYLVIFIDELADLMLSSQAAVEDSIARLAQMARASGMHLVLATQRPSVDVITGVIKANFPARIAFQVTTKIDSRTIIDSQGAESLIGRGDMLFMQPGVKLLRVHGALVTEQEVNTIVAHCAAQGSPDYSLLEMIDQTEAEATAEAAYSDERDDLYYRSIEIAQAMGEVSISSLQRRLKVGYNRAARIMELMEEDGLVGPQKGAGKPRDFLGRHNA